MNISWTVDSRQACIPGTWLVVIPGWWYGWSRYGVWHATSRYCTYERAHVLNDQKVMPDFQEEDQKIIIIIKNNNDNKIEKR